MRRAATGPTRWAPVACQHNSTRKEREQSLRQVTRCVAVQLSNVNHSSALQLNQLDVRRQAG